jgi:cytochrome c oxidase subunit IV
MANENQHVEGGHVEGQQHPIGVYIKIWAWLFVLSTASYMVDYLHVQGYLRWTLIIIFMLAKAGLIVAVFMHIMWERLALVYAILGPPIAVLIFTALMASESGYTAWMRNLFFSAPS